MGHREIRAQVLALVAAVVGIVSFGLFQLVARTGELVPRPPLLAAVLLLVMAGLVLWLARPVRQYLRGRATKSLDPLRAARTVVLAQAAALTGAAAAGWYAGQLAVVLTELSLLANQSRVVPLALLVVAGVVLAGAGSVAQRWCRIDPGEDDRDDETERRDRTERR
jgi:hypothetical protein